MAPNSASQSPWGAAGLPPRAALQRGPGPCGVAEVSLPIDKTDISGIGKVRAHCCACPAPACPVKALKALLATKESPGGYLVSQPHGAPLTKQMVVTAFRGWQKLPAIQTHDPSRAIVGEYPERNAWRAAV